MSAPVALTLFHQLCDVGNALAHVRDGQAPCSDTWTALTCILLTLNASIDVLVRSTGLGGDDDATPDALMPDAPRA